MNNHESSLNIFYINVLERSMVINFIKNQITYVSQDRSKGQAHLSLEVNGIDPWDMGVWTINFGTMVNVLKPGGASETSTPGGCRSFIDATVDEMELIADGFCRRSLAMGGLW